METQGGGNAVEPLGLDRGLLDALGSASKFRPAQDKKKPKAE